MVERYKTGELIKLTIIRAIAFLLHFTLVPAAFGQLITYRVKEESLKTPIIVYITGLLGSWGVFYLLFAVLEWHQNWITFNEIVTGCFTGLSIAYSAICLIVVVAAAFLFFKKRKQFTGDTADYLKNTADDYRKNKFTFIYLGIFILLVAIQCYFAFGYEINEWSYDDYDYVVSSLDTLDKDILANTNIVTGAPQTMLEKRAVASWTTYISYLAKVSGFEVTTICHTIMPVLLLLVAYAVYFWISGLLFKEIDNRLIFMNIFATALMFGQYSHYSLTFRMLCTLWQGKAVLFTISVPFLLAYYIKLYSEDIDNGCILPLIAVSMGSTSLSAMSMMVVGLVVVLTWVAMSIYSKKPQSLRYLIAGMTGPIFQYVFYQLIVLLLEDMQGHWPQHFNRSREKSWWYRWFG